MAGFCGPRVRDMPGYGVVSMMRPLLEMGFKWPELGIFDEIK